MERIEVIQKIINKKKAKNYLEIGVSKGDCFLKIKAKRKFAVDPSFRIDWDIRKDNIWKKINRKALNTFELYYQITSNEFFKNNKNKFDVVFVDGLHTHQQSLKDILNVLDCLNDDGIIIMHDCNPISEAQAYPAKSLEDALDLKIPGWNGEWSGDVWKTILNLRVTKENLDIYVLNCDCGLGIIKRGNSKSLNIGLDENDIQNLPYQFLELNREKILNLKPVEYFEDFIRTL